MHPQIEVFGFEIGAYRLLTIMALVAATGVTAWIAKLGGLGRRATTIFLAATLTGALVGARSLAIVTASDPFAGGLDELLALRFGNMAMFGGLGGAVIGGLLAARWSGERPERLADMAAPAIALGIVVLRTGCLLAGCCVGNDSNVGWAITYPEGSWSHLNQRAGSVFSVFDSPRPVHPIPVYEMIAGVILMVIAVRLVRGSSREGAAFAVVVGGYALVRLMIHPVRLPEPGNTPSWFDPMMYLVVTVATATWLARPALAFGSSRPLSA